MSCQEINPKLFLFMSVGRSMASIQPKKNKARPVTNPPTTNPINTPTLGLIPLIPPLASPSNKAEFFKSELVLPNCILSTPECPFEVANTACATLAVFWALLYAVVGNVFVASLIDTNGSWGGEEEVLERKTRAKPGAGTGTVHTLMA